MTRRRKYLLLLVPVAMLVVLLWAMLASNWGLAVGLRIAASVIPGELSVSENHGSLLGRMQLQGLRYHNADVTVFIQQVDLSLRVSSLLAGKLSIQNLTVNNIRIDVHAQTTQPKTGPTAQQPNQPMAIRLPIALEIIQSRVNKLTIKAAGTSVPVVIDQASLSASSDRQTIRVRQFTVQAYQSQGKFAGTASLAEHFPLDLAVDLTYQVDATHQLSGSGTLVGDLRGLRLSQTLSGLVQAKLTAEVKDVLTTLHWTTQLEVAHLDVHNLLRQSPSIAVQGKLTADGDLQTMRAESQLQLEDKRVGLAHVQLKADSDLLLTGYHFTAEGDFIGVELPEAKLSLQGKGDLQHVELSHLLINALKGDVQGQARITWQPHFAVNTQLDVHKLQSGMLSKDWPGQLSAQLSLASQSKAKSQALLFTVHKLTGELRGYPLEAEAKGSWAPQQLALDKLQLVVGGTTLTAHGKLAQQWDVTFQAHSDDLNSLLPGAKGKLDLNGQLLGTQALPRLRLTGEAKQLAYAEETIGALNLKLDMGLASHAAAQLDLQANKVRTRAGRWKNVQLQVNGSNAAQQGNLAAIGKLSSVHMQWHGKFAPWRWQGSLDQFRISQTHVDTWELQQPVAIVLAQNQIQLSQLCLAQDSSHLCTQLQWDKTQHQARIDGKAVPLRFIGPWLPNNMQLGGQVDVQGTLNLVANDKFRAKLAMHSADKSIVINFGDIKQQLTLGASSVTAELDDKGLHSRLRLPLSEGGGLESEVRLPGWSPQHGLPRAQAIQASLTLDHIPADVITRFTPEMARAKGYLQADLHLNGSLGEPRLRGEAKWQEGTVAVPIVGITIRDIRAEVKTEQINRLVFQVQARSGDGDVKLDGHIQLEPGQGWPIHATLSSHNLEVSNIPEAYILVDSKLQVSVQGNNINLDGEITIPRARLQPHTLPEGAVPVSPDIVIVRGKKQTTRLPNWLLTSHLRLQLGDQVDFNGFRARGKLRGTVMINDEPGKLAMGQGEISVVDGSYRMSGQDLTIRRGRLVFSNTFIDDPVLDVEAVRKIDTITTGVRIKGTLKQPQLSVFSEPVMPETEALSYLVLGHSSAQNTAAEGQSISNTAMALGFVAGDYLEKGIGGRLGLDELRLDVNQTTQNTSLIMGKYLSPKLVVRYYTGIAEPSHILQLQYHISKRILIQTESGYTGSQPTTGGDIYFTVEY